MHRDLNPKNIVFDIDPLQVKIIDFTAAYPREQKTIGLYRSTPGYFPASARWPDGSVAWDYYSLGVIVLEASLSSVVLKDVRSHQQLMQSLTMILLQKDFPPALKLILEGTIMQGNHDDMISPDDLIQLLTSTPFKQY